MYNTNFITAQDVLQSTHLAFQAGMQKSAGMEKQSFRMLMPILRRAAVSIPKLFTGNWWGTRGILNLMNRMAGGGVTLRNAARTGNVWKPTRGTFNTTNGGWITNNFNKLRNFIQDATYKGSMGMRSFNKKLDMFAKAGDKAAFGSPTVRKLVTENGKQVWKDVPNPLYKKWQARGAGIIGGGLGIGAAYGAMQLPVVGDAMSAAFSYGSPIGLGITAYDKGKQYLTDKVVVPQATDAAYTAMNSTLQGVNNMDTMQRLGFLLSPQQAQAQMQAQAEQEFARQAWAQQQELWKQRRGE